MAQSSKTRQKADRIDQFYSSVIKNCIHYNKPEDQLNYLSRVSAELNNILLVKEKINKKRFEEKGTRPNTNTCENNDTEGDSCSTESRDKNEFFVVVKVGNNYCCEIKECVDAVQRVKQKFNITQLDDERTENFNETKNYTGIKKINVKSSITDIVRIFESMKKAGIISTKTTTKQIAELFFTEVMDLISFEKKYNAAKSKIDNYNHSSNSNELINFLKLLTEDSFKNKDLRIEELIHYLERLQKFAI